MTKIEDWLLTEREWPSGFSDFHIDHFDREWRARSLWVEGGANLLDAAAKATMLAGLQIRLAMVYTLVNKRESHSPNVWTSAAFPSLLDHSPPSIFAAKRGSEPWIESQRDERVRVIHVASSIVGRVFPSSSVCEGIILKYAPEKLAEPSISVWFIPQLQM